MLPKMERIDLAHETFRSLLSEIGDYQNTIYSEEDTRVKVIDRVFTDVLGWPFADFTTEVQAGNGFIDYRYQVNGVNRLIVEAKRDGIRFGIDDSYSGRALKLSGPVLNKKAVKDGLEQAIGYAAHKGVELACLTNGHEWLVFRANRMGDGKDVLDGFSIVFSSLNEVAKGFNLFYDLLSREALSDLKFRAVFTEAEGTPIRTRLFQKVLIRADENRVVRREEYAHDFDKIMAVYFDKLSAEHDTEMLAQCFVRSDESDGAEKRLGRIAEELVSNIRTLETGQADHLTRLIERVRSTKRNEFVVLVGGKGAGKSTFVDRFFTIVLPSELRTECIILRVNLAEHTGDERTVIQWLNSQMRDIAEKVIFGGTPTYDELLGMYFGEYERWRKGTHRDLYQTDKTEFKIQFGKHIEKRREENPEEYLRWSIRHAVRSRKKLPCIVFDNTDHFRIEFQDRVFQYARSIYEQELCLVMVPITEKTSWHLSQQGALESFSNESLFLPTPSPKRVIERRIAYLDRKVQEEKSGKAKYFLAQGISLNIADIQRYVGVLQSVFLSNRTVASWIGNLANFDVRRCLALTREIVTSPHLGLSETLKVYVGGDLAEVKPYKIRRALINKSYEHYPEGNNKFVHNIYNLGQVNDVSPLMVLRVLQLLSDAKKERPEDDSYLRISEILDYFTAMGIESVFTQRVLGEMLQRGLCYSYDPTHSDIKDVQRVELSPAGKQHHLWGLTENDYLYAMMEVTPMRDEVPFEQIITERGFFNLQSRYTQMIHFLNYLRDEDSLYCNVPNQQSFLGQKKILERMARRTVQLTIEVTKIRRQQKAQRPTRPV